MRVVVTGGAGFIGSHIARHYASAGADVTAVDDLSGGRADAIPGGIRFLQADIADPSASDVVASVKPDLIVHAAAQVSVARSVTDQLHDRTVNVDGTRHIVTAADRCRARIVFLSSGGAIYGETAGADESSPPEPLSPYGRHKLEAETLVARALHGFGIARLANVYGPGQRQDLEGGVVAVFVDRVSNGRPVEIYGNGEQTRDFVHVDDVVSGVSAIGGAQASGLWNVGTGVATPIQELLTRIERIVGVKAVAYERPARAGDVKASRLIVKKIERDLGWRPTIDLDTGLASVAAVMANWPARAYGD